MSIPPRPNDDPAFARAKYSHDGANAAATDAPTCRTLANAIDGTRPQRSAKSAQNRAPQRRPARCAPRGNNDSHESSQTNSHWNTQANQLPSPMFVYHIFRTGDSGGMKCPATKFRHTWVCPSWELGAVVLGANQKRFFQRYHVKMDRFVYQASFFWRNGLFQLVRISVLKSEAGHTKVPVLVGKAT